MSASGDGDDPRYYYEQDGQGRYRATAVTVGPWSPKLQHGGPPSALIGRALEAEAAKAGLPFVARVTIAFFRPIKLVARLEVEARPVRVGTKIAHLEACLFGTIDEAPASPNNNNNSSSSSSSHKRLLLAKATAVASRVKPMKEGALPEPPAELAMTSPKPAASVKPFDDLSMVGYGRSMDFRLVKAAGDYIGNGPTESWARIGVTIVKGDADPPSALERTLAYCDSAGGFSGYIPMDEFSFVNADTTLNLLRPMQGEWSCMRARTDLCGATGQGLATAELWDEAGFYGRVSQQQVLESRL